MDLRKKAFVIVFTGTVVAISFFSFFKPVPYKHVFINETEDHRFDESIQVSILASYKRTGVQNAVVISSRTQEKDLEQQAVQAFQDLKLGRANNGRAILYYFNPEAKALKIEVGKALEGVLPDVTVKGLEMAAKSFIFVDKYQDFWAELINTINIEIQKKENQSGQALQEYDFSQFKFLSGGGGISSNSYTASWRQLLLESKRVPPEGLEKYRGQRNVETAVQLYLESLQAGYGDLDLDLLTPESWFSRKITPHSSYQLFRNANMYRSAGLDQVFENGDLAFAFFKPNHPVLPIVLKRVAGVWRIHEPLSWSLFQRFEDSNQIFFKFPVVGLTKETQNYISQKLGKSLFSLENPLSLDYLKQDALSDWKSSLIHLYWLDRAQKDISSQGPSRLSNDDLKMASDVYMNLGQMTPFLECYEELAKRFPKDEIIQRNIVFYREVLEFKDTDWIRARP